MSEPTADPSRRWGMVIDLNRCVGCQTCTIACKHANDTAPEVQWRRVVDVEEGAFPDVQRFFLVTGCQHCADPPCVPVCPTGATFQRPDGIVDIDYGQCIGCGYCAVACPYEARTIVKSQAWYYGESTAQERAVAHQDRIGVAQKCTFCADRVEAGLDRGLTPGIDPAATPACAAACITQAISFGDFNDKDSNVSKLTETAANLQINAELGADPQIKYLYETPAVPGRDVAADEDRLRDPENPLVGRRQTFWDWRAAMNWMMGGLGSGYAIVLWCLYLAGRIQPDTLAQGNVTAAVLMAIGLFSVFMKLGRPMRSWRAILRPQSSWMTRELYAAAVFYPAVGAGYLWQSPAAFWLAGLAAAAFLFSQAQILYRARGIPAWRSPLIPWMVVASGLAEGVGLLAFSIGLPRGFPVVLDGVAEGAILLLVVNAMLWRAYVSGAVEEGIGPLARDALDEVNQAIRIGGYMVPVVLFAIAALAPHIPLVIYTVAGLAAIAGGAFWKWAVLLRAGYHQGFVLPRAPQRGSGAFAAPSRLGGAAE